MVHILNEVHQSQKSHHDKDTKKSQFDDFC